MSERSAGPGRQGRADSQRVHRPALPSPDTNIPGPGRGQALLSGTFTEGQRSIVLPFQRAVARAGSRSSGSLGSSQARENKLILLAGANYINHFTFHLGFKIGKTYPDSLLGFRPS